MCNVMVRDQRVSAPLSDSSPCFLLSIFSFPSSLASSCWWQRISLLVVCIRPAPLLSSFSLSSPLLPFVLSSSPLLSFSPPLLSLLPSPLPSPLYKWFRIDRFYGCPRFPSCTYTENMAGNSKKRKKKMRGEEEREEASRRATALATAMATWSRRKWADYNAY